MRYRTRGERRTLPARLLWASMSARALIAGVIALAVGCGATDVGARAARPPEPAARHAVAHQRARHRLRGARARPRAPALARHDLHAARPGNAPGRLLGHLRQRPNRPLLGVQRHRGRPVRPAGGGAPPGRRQAPGGIARRQGRTAITRVPQLRCRSVVWRFFGGTYSVAIHTASCPGRGRRTSSRPTAAWRGRTARCPRRRRWCPKPRRGRQAGVRGAGEAVGAGQGEHHRGPAGRVVWTAG